MGRKGENNMTVQTIYRMLTTNTVVVIKSEIGFMIYTGLVDEIPVNLMDVSVEHFKPLGYNTLLITVSLSENDH